MSHRGMSLEASLSPPCWRVEEVPALSLDLVGHVVTDSVSLRDLSTPAVRVRVHTDLPHKQFYRAIGAARFLLLGLGEDAYLVTRATSSVPAALSARVPLVAPAAYLTLYPCLRDAPVHRALARSTECASVAAALSLDAIHYRAAQREVANCSMTLWMGAQRTFAALATKSTPHSGTG
jgi:hypothetical protein